MKVSYNWLAEYFDAPLPSPEEVGELLTFHAYELEGIEQVGDDYVIDVDILPNRSGDSLSHRGIARELATLLDCQLKHDPIRGAIEEMKKSNICSVEVVDTELCDRYTSAVIQGVSIGPSPDWLKKALETLGQRSINNVVDATNYVMLNMGQPLHAFDADKLAGDTKKILVRTAKDGEAITTLSEDTYTLTPETLLITDAVTDTPIAIAGVKGGKHADVDSNTTNIVLESAHFNPTSVRKTTQRIKLFTDASQRFQNNPSAELVGYALHDVVKLILEIAGGTLEGGSEVRGAVQGPEVVTVDLVHINGLLGTAITVEEVSDILERLGCIHDVSGEVFTVTPPFERRDIVIAEDVIEEIGRVYGYEHLEAKQLPEIEKKPEVHKGFYFADSVRNVLTEAGYSEVYGYTFRSKGVYEAINALASDKRFLRTNLSEGLNEYLEMNTHNAPLFGVDRIKIFEIGTVFTKEGEHISLALGVSGKKTDTILNDTKTLLERTLGVSINESPENNVLEINFTQLIDGLQEGERYEPFEKNFTMYTSYSPYPFITRDIAVWVPEGTTSESIKEIISAETGELMHSVRLFDEFQKEGRVSYAFRLVFQSMEKTLTDEEVNPIMDMVYKTLAEKSYEIR